MIFARIDNLSDKNITGFECGTRADFDIRHGGDPLWLFFDFASIKQRVNTAEFLSRPTTFFVDKYNIIQRKSVSP